MALPMFCQLFTGENWFCQEGMRMDTGLSGFMEWAESGFSALACPQPARASTQEATRTDPPLFSHP